MPTPLDSKNLRISSPPISEEKELPFIDPRIKKIVASLLGASIGLGVAGGFCFTAKVSCAVALLVASVALATLGLVVVANSLADRFFPQTLAKVVHAVHATVTDLLAFSFQLLFYAASPLCKERIRTEGDDRPILFVHGYLHNASAWALYMFGDFLGLPTIGFKNTYAVSLPLFCSIERSSEIVRTKLEEIAKATGKTNMVLLGHSMGGLVVTDAAFKLQENNSSGITITHVVTLGTPFKGARGIVDYFGFGENGKQMRPNSEFLTTLQSKLLNAQFKILQVASVNDALVSEDSALIVLSDVNQSRLPVSDVGHAALPLSLSLMDEVVEFLKSETV
jgi:triacylglycerol lipase